MNEAIRGIMIPFIGTSLGAALTPEQYDALDRLRRQK